MATSQRHRFHQKHFGMLVVSAMLVLLGILILLIELPKPILFNGFLFALLVVLYFLIHKRLYFLKELFVAILYSGGVLLPSLALMNNEMITPQYFIVLFFALTTLVNLILFSWCDREHDKADKHQSLVSSIGERKTSRLLFILFGIQGCIGSLGLMMSQVDLFVVVLLAMNGIMFFILLKWKWFIIHDRYRLLGDAIFFFPILILLGN
jgi:4-hydroxybenzoate polyprenyltransferase